MGSIRLGFGVVSDITVGTLLADRYEILSELGRGRVGIVFKANHKRLEKFVAVKVLFEDVGQDETSIKRFELEAKASGRLNHPNIISVLDFGLSNQSFPYLVMEYLDGMDLHNVLTEDQRVPLGRTVRIITQVCAALSHAHGRGVIHRDLKPSNIMLMNMDGYPDFIKLVDFGIAKRYDADNIAIEKLTMDGQVLGTPAYMSPEQCQAGKLDARSDIYSLGCVMFKMLTGQAPIGGTSIIEIIHNHIGQKPLSFAEACPDVRVPPAIQEVVLTALEKDPARRHQTMAEFGTLLANAAAASGLPPMGLLANLTPSTSFPAFQPGANVRTTGSTPIPAGGMPQPVFQAQVSPQVDSPTAPPALQKLSGSFGAPIPFGAGPIPGITPGVPAGGIAPQEAPIDEADQVYKARKYEQLIEAAKTGDVRAQYEIAIRLQNGDGVDSNPTESLKWLRAAAQNGHRDAQYRLGKKLLDGDGMMSPSPVEGFQWVYKAAENRLAPAHLMVAICYEEGRGTAPNLLKAIHHYRVAIRAGNRLAEPRLSACYQQCFDAGIQAEGFDEWLESRAADGDIDAMYTIAYHLKRSGSTARLSKQAVPHLLPAAQAGNIKAQMALAHVYLEGRQPDDHRNAVFWLQKAMTLGDKDALLLLAVAFKNGMGVPKDNARAADYLQQATDQGHLMAQALLGVILLIGDGVPRNLTRGITYLRNAANAGSSFAQWKLALCLKNGIGTLRDPKEAEKWFEKASEEKFDQGPPWQYTVQGLAFNEAIQTFQSLASIENRQAFYWLGICYEYGVSIPRDLNRALDYYQRAASKGFQPAVEAVSKLKSLMTTAV